MNISIKNSDFPFTISFQKRIWMQYIYWIAKYQRNKENCEEKLALIAKIQKEINEHPQDRVDVSCSIDFNKNQLVILYSVSQGLGISEEKYSKTWDEARGLVKTTYKQFKMD